MKKDKLIDLLNSLEGNPDILLWNGMVGDWMDIDKELIESDLVKETFEHYKESCRLEDIRDNPDLGWDYQLSEEKIIKLRKYYKKNVAVWASNEFITEEYIRDKLYTKKTVFFINPKTRNETYFDRQGFINY